MTRGEKEQAFTEECRKYRNCDGCPMDSHPTCATGSMSDEELDEALRRFGEASADKDACEIAPESTPDNVNHPTHYELPGGIECFDVLIATQGKEAVQAFCICNAIKYLFRHKRKNGREDVEKARWYLDKYIELEKEGTWK